MFMYVYDLTIIFFYACVVNVKVMEKKNVQEKLNPQMTSVLFVSIFFGIVSQDLKFTFLFLLFKKSLASREDKQYNVNINLISCEPLESTFISKDPQMYHLKVKFKIYL